MSDEVTILWVTAEVTVRRDAYFLTVQLDDEPSEFWTKELIGVAERLQDLSRFDWSINLPTRGDRLEVMNVRPGTEGAVRRALDKIVAAASDQAVQAHAKYDAQQQAAEAEAAAKESAAEAMTAQFRALKTA